MPDGSTNSDEPEWLQSMDKSIRFYVYAPRAAAGSLYRQLTINEDQFARTSAIGVSDAQSFYLYAAASEVYKAGIAIIRWAGLISKPEQPVEDDLVARQAERLCVESICDEQHLWQRKLTEWLVNLIAFGTTNSEEYYRLFLAAEANDYELAELSDLRKTYACDSGNVQVRLRHIRERFATEMRRVQADRCWFLKVKKVPDEPRKMLATLRDRLDTAINQATPGEKLCLGVSYARGFGTASRSLHPAVASARLHVTANEIKRRLMMVGLLGLHVMHRAHELAGVKPTGRAERVFARLDNSVFASSLFQGIHTPGYDEGDLVLAFGHLAEVLERNISPYGLESYRVRFLVRAPLDETPEDWIPASWAQPILRRQWSRQFLRNHLSAKPEMKRLVELIESCDDEELTIALRAGLVDMERRGIPLLPLMPLSENPEIL